MCKIIFFIKQKYLFSVNFSIFYQCIALPIFFIMKKSILFIYFLVFTFSIYAQAPISKGKMQINTGLGLSNWGIPVYAGIDVGIHPDITAGMELSYRQYQSYGKWGKSNFPGADASIIGIYGNVNYHFNKLFHLSEEWNVYAGVNIGYHIWSFNKPYNNNGKIINSGSDTASVLGLGLQIGGRYYFTKRFGVNLELGGGNSFSNGKIGISVKL